MRFLTGFGDLAILLPLAVAIGCWLAAIGARRAAWRWLLAVGLCMGGIGLLKMYFFACPTGEALQSPSGHTGFAALVYGAIFAFISAHAPRPARLAIRAVGVALIAGIALSRLVLEVHTPLDVASGLLIGLLALGFFLWEDPNRLTSAPTLRPLLLTTVAIIVLLHGQQLHAEAMLQALGGYLKGGGLLCS
jgi:membrane-associated phospholipid phosphatase